MGRIKLVPQRIPNKSLIVDCALKRKAFLPNPKSTGRKKRESFPGLIHKIKIMLTIRTEAEF